MQVATIDRILAEHSAIMGQARWVGEWVGLQPAGNNPPPAPRYNVDNRYQLRNMIIDLEQGLKNHYTREENVLAQLSPETLHQIHTEHDTVLKLMAYAEGLTESQSSEKDRLEQVITEMLRKIEDHNSLEESVFRLLRDIQNLPRTLGNRAR